MAKYETMLVTSAALDEEASTALPSILLTIGASAVWLIPSTTRKKASTP